ncbi:MAG: VTT domain-containing protein [Bradyrhizobium sp.]|uniref:VTT domain-containing protein n=1 Tax=Bradyrhizobium sp. TaxID=376 RepID=UPI0027302812|nr:VTT domain-containing protein [Bradyrhizobium sp.]MDP1869894.1 VTT domain-containing protein [Bradyrhizobium sp.]
MLQSSSILIPGRTVWKRCEASRVAVLNDAAAYFGALRDALLLAERQVHILGWDIHSETPLVGPSGRADDGLPIALGPFLTGLLKVKPELQINILVWDFATLYAVEREWNSADKFTAGCEGRIRFCLDSSLPLGSSQHQKIVVIDNAIAFSGGLDLTIRRWDTSEHLAEHPLRRDPDGKPYAPFHDVQCMVEGEAAAALGEIAAARWAAAGCVVEGSETVAGDRWPASVPAGTRQIQAAIARTELRTTSQVEVDEVARLFEASINAASRFIYIENQFTSATEIAEMLAQRMADVPSLRVLIVTPKAHSSWLESQAMQGGRGGFMDPFVAAGVADRLRILYPAVADEESSAAVMIHSKVMIVDDGFLRIGSANLNNRSMGADTECDLAFEADGDEHSEFIRDQRRRLIGHFCGVDGDTIAENEDDLLGFLDRHAAAGTGRALLPIECEPTPVGAVADIIQPIADPKRPLNLARTARRMWTPRTVLAVAGTAAALAGLALAWHTTSLRDFTDIGYVASGISRYAQSAFAPVFAVMAFVLGGLVVFPVVVLIAATAAALGPGIGALSAFAGVLASSLLLFMIGRFLGHKRLQSLLGARALRVQRRIVGKGVVAVAMIRMVPVAPFSLVNVLAGASQLRLTDFLIGTVIGMAPGIIAMAAVGAQIADFARNASWSNAAPLGLTILLWIALCLAVQFVVTWWSGRRA